MLLLFETSVGYALFNVNEQQFNQIKSWKDLPSSFDKLHSLCQLAAFKKFEDSKEVLQAAVKLIHGKLSNTLAKFL